MTTSSATCTRGRRISTNPRAADLVDAIEHGLREHTTLDLDALPELDLSDLIATFFAGAVREVVYPSALRGRGRRGTRCDIVIGRWFIEVKRASRVGPAGEDPWFAHRFLQVALEDVVKLATDPALTHRLFLGLLFDEPERARDVVRALAHESVDHRVQIGVPICRSFDIVDWRGNASCTVAGIEVYSPV